MRLRSAWRDVTTLLEIHSDKLARTGASHRLAMPLLYGALVALPLIVLWSFRHAGFVSDDVFFGPGFHLDSWRDVWLGPWPHPIGLSKAWRPVVVLLYLVESAWSDGGSFGYHLFNDLLHGANAALLAALVWQLTRERTAAAVAGVLFAVHPMVHENVQWISGRTYPAAAFFVLALCVWTVGAPRRRAWLQHAVGLTLLAAALASYEFSIAAPFAVAGVAWLAWGRPSSRGSTSRESSSRSSWRALAWFALPYFALLAVYFAFRWLWLTSLDADVLVAARASRWALVPPVGLRALRNLSFALLRFLAFPWFDRLSDARIGATGVLTTVVVAWSIATVVRHATTLRAVGVWWIVWVGLFYAPVAPAAAFSDRFGYLSVAGVAALIGIATAISLDARHGALRRGAFGAIVLAVAIGWTSDLRAHGREWDEAGRIAISFLDQLRQQEPPPDRPVALHFVDVPGRHHSALVFLTYFHLAVRRAFPEPQRANVIAYLETEPEDSVVRRLREESRDAEPEQVRVYRWNAATERLELRWQRD